MAISPPPLGSQPLSGSTTVDLLGNNLTQWASHMQDITSHMRLPPEAAASCPQLDIVGVLNRLEGMTQVRYCRHCFGVGQRCRCSAIPHQAPGPTLAHLGTTHSELRGHGLFHRDHGQHLCSWGNSPELPATWDASTQGHGHVAGSHY